MTLARPYGFGGSFRDDAEARSVYSEAAGIGRILPRAVAVPRNVADVQSIVLWAREAGHPLVPRGSGSSMAGGAIGSGVVLDLSRLRGIGDADVAGRRIRAEVGALRGEVQARASAAGVGLRFPVDPSSGEFCTIGGMVATNASGPHSLRHGSTRPWVLAIDCVFDDGSLATVRRGEPAPDVPAIRRFTQNVRDRLLEPDIARGHAVLKESSGYGIGAYAETHELVDLLVGSEGTLAIFTAVEMALIPAVRATASMLAGFRDVDAAAASAALVRERGASCCELLDRTFLAIAARGGHPLPVPATCEAVLLIEVEESDGPSAAAAVQDLSNALRAAGATVSITAVDAAHELALWAFRHAASPALGRLDPALRSMQFIEDAAVPPQHLGDYVRGVREILDAHDTPGVIFGHAGDAHVHVNPLVDVSRAGWRSSVDAILDAATDLVARLGGTLSGEHGDGRLRAPLLPRVWTVAELELFAAIKGAFDPEGVLNPGVKVPRAGERAIGDVKYDPALPAHPPLARLALDVVERERAYSRFRLDLV